MPPPRASWPFDRESGVQVKCGVDYLCANFSLSRPLCSRLRPDVHDRQTSSSDVHHLWMPPTYRGGGLIDVINPVHSPGRWTEIFNWSLQFCPGSGNPAVCKSDRCIKSMKHKHFKLRILYCLIILTVAVSCKLCWNLLCFAIPKKNKIFSSVLVVEVVFTCGYLPEQYYSIKAPCGFQGCKNWPAPFPGWMSYNATKPGLALF